MKDKLLLIYHSSFRLLHSFFNPVYPVHPVSVPPLADARLGF
jgi:hypothetical protein